MDSAQNIFSYCVGALALVSTILSVLSYSRRYLPTTQLRRLDELLLETKNIYHKANDEELLPEDVSMYAQTTLILCEDESDRLREVTYRARSRFETLRLLFLGHTRQIMWLAEEVRDLRALVVTVSQDEKERKARESETSGVLLSSHMDEASDFTFTSCIDSNHGDLGLPSSSCVSESVPQHPSLQPMATGQPTDDYSSPDPVAAPFTSPLDHSRRTSMGFVCSVSEWWAGKSRVPPTSLPTSALPEADQRLPTFNATVFIRSSTLVNEPPQKSIERRWSLLSNPFSVYVSVLFGRQTGTDQEPNLDDISIPSGDSATTSPV